jgi:hypothetical protein
MTFSQVSKKSWNWSAVTCKKGTWQIWRLNVWHFHDISTIFPCMTHCQPQNAGLWVHFCSWDSGSGTWPLAPKSSKQVPLINICSCYIFLKFQYQNWIYMLLSKLRIPQSCPSGCSMSSRGKDQQCCGRGQGQRADGPGLSGRGCATLSLRCHQTWLENPQFIDNYRWPKMIIDDHRWL